MSKKPGLKSVTRFASALALSLGTAAQAAPSDFTTWTVIEDPEHDLLDASATPTEATLTAGDGAIPAEVDIGYASVNGSTVAGSTAGFAFSAASDFTVAITYDLSFVNPAGGLGIGFGIGEDVAGANSAGIALATANGVLPTFAAGARNNDVTIGPAILGGGSLTGTFFAAYDADTGDITVSASATPDAAAPDLGGIILGATLNQWTGADLLVSFFIRSDAVPALLINNWTGEQATAVFSNFRVLDGAPILIPEPASLALLGLGGLAIGLRRRRA